MKIIPIKFHSYSSHENKSQKRNANFNDKNSFCNKFTLSNFQAPNFTSLKTTSENEHKYLGTAFYRDLNTLINVSDLIRQEFPNGTDIMDFACSNGEEAISLYSLINDKNNCKYKIHCYDTSDKAIKLAKLNVHSIFNGTPDEFLIDKKPLNEIYKNIARCFNELMEEVTPPNFEINDKDFIDLRRKEDDFIEKYFKVKDEYFSNFEFKKGDIRDILNIQPEKKVGAVFFRNAFYHITNNHTFERVYDKKTLDKILETNKEEVIQDVVDKVYEKLLPGGFFVLGDDEKEHIYQADKYTPNDEIYFDDITDEYLRIKSPLLKALKKDGKFKPVLSSKCKTMAMGDFTVYTVWQKVEK